MYFARKVWHLIVAVKDGLSLMFLLLFFFAIYAVLTARPSPAAVRDGALLLQLDGTIVEERIYHDAGATTSQGLRRAELLQLIRRAGREPVERDTLYRPVQRGEATFTVLV